MIIGSWASCEYSTEKSIVSFVVNANFGKKRLVSLMALIDLLPIYAYTEIMMMSIRIVPAVSIILNNNG